MPRRAAICAFATPSAASLRISAQSSKVITPQSLRVFTFQASLLSSFRASPRRPAPVRRKTPSAVTKTGTTTERASPYLAVLRSCVSVIRPAPLIPASSQATSAPFLWLFATEAAGAVIRNAQCVGDCRSISMAVSCYLLRNLPVVGRGRGRWSRCPLAYQLVEILRQRDSVGSHALVRAVIRRPRHLDLRLAR